MARPTPNFVILNGSLPDVGRLVAAMLRSGSREPLSVASAGADDRGMVGRRARRSPRTNADTRRKRADGLSHVLSPRRRSKRHHPGRLQQMRLESAFRRDDLLATHGAACPMPSLLERLAAPGCLKVGSQWDRCGVHYVDPIEGQRGL